MPMHRERVIQSALCDHIRKEYPGVIFASDTAASLPLSKGLAVLQARHKSPSRGYPDLFIAAKRGKFAGCFIELKAEGERIFLKDGSVSTTEHIQRQNSTLAALRNEGYCAEFVIGYEQAQSFVDWYLTGADGDLLIERNKDGDFRFTNTGTGEIF
jgi:hypothetical protein